MWILYCCGRSGNRHVIITSLRLEKGGWSYDCKLHSTIHLRLLAITIFRGRSNQTKKRTYHSQKNLFRFARFSMCTSCSGCDYATKWVKISHVIMHHGGGTSNILPIEGGDICYTSWQWSEIRPWDRHLAMTPFTRDILEKPWSESVLLVLSLNAPQYRINPKWQLETNAEGKENSTKEDSKQVLRAMYEVGNAPRPNQRKEQRLQAERVLNCFKRSHQLCQLCRICA